MLPITRITLYTSGVGYFERGGEVEGNAQITLHFPLGAVNDVLKSLVLLDGGGGEIAPVTYAAQDPVRRALQAFSLNIGDEPDRATLLGRMRGVSVTVTTGDPAPLTGVVAGVETRDVFLPDGSGMTQQSRLTLLAGDSLHTVSLDTVRSLQINDAALAGELRGALAAVAQGRDAGKRTVTLTFTGAGRRTVQAAYLLESPAWQTSYRLVLGETPRLQGWALVQNTGQDDWTDTRLSLVSGRPISFIQDLYTPLYVHRPTVQPRIPASPTPQTYASDLMEDTVQERGISAAEPADAAYAVMAAPAPAAGGVSSLRQRKGNAQEARGGMDPSQALQGSIAASGAALGAAFAYEIGVPVSVPRQQSAMIPFVAEAVDAERVSVYNSRVQSSHPLTGVRLRNTTDLHLMGGPLTVFETPDAGGAAGYVGDALMDDTEAGQSRLLTYALDLAVDADLRHDPQSGVVSEVRLAQGTLHVRQTYQQITEYVFKNHSAGARTLIVEHPVRPGWELTEPDAPAERTAAEYRFALPLAGRAAATLRVRLERQAWEALRLLDTAADLFLVYGRSGAAPASVRTALEDIAARQARLAEAEAEAAALNKQIESITQGQERIRKNMEALDYNSDLYRRYVGELDAQETQIASLLASRDARQTALDAAQADFSRHVASLTV